MERRFENRTEVRQPVEVTIFEASGAQHCGFVADISSGGLRALTDERLAAGQGVAVYLEDQRMVCEVRYCHARGEGFTVGLELIMSTSGEDPRGFIEGIGKLEAEAQMCATRGGNGP
jgi:hypothetical protein